MFIKVKGEQNYTKSPNQLTTPTTFLININQIAFVKFFPNGSKEDYMQGINMTDDSVIYTDDDVTALIQQRMATPYDGVIPEPPAKQYRDPILPQDLNVLAEFSDNNKDWDEGYLTSYSQMEDETHWGGRLITQQFKYFKYCRIEVKT